MKLLCLLLLSAGMLPAASAVPPETSLGPPRPHIVFFLADDLGWGDVGFHGGEIRTPHIDQLAAAGARLEAFYVQPVCSPTRAALLTGRYPMRHGLQTGVVRPWATYGLPLNERTLPQALRETGYATAICGKWHLGHFHPDYLPMARGFDHQYGHYNGALDYFSHERDGGFDWHRDQQACRDTGYATTLLAREAVRLIQQHDPQQPLFLYVPFNAVHSPYQVPEQYLQPYAQLSGNRRIYAGMLAAMDEAIGQIVTAITERGMRSQTLFVFSSDNGGPAPGRVTSNGPLRGAKGSLYEGGVRVAACAAWDGRIPAGTVVTEPLHMVDWYPTLLTLAGASLQQPLPLDGRDVWPTITAGQPSPHSAILLNTSPRNGAIRVGHWKLVVNGQLPDAELTGENTAVPEPADAAPASRSARQQRRQPAAARTAAQTDRLELFDLSQDIGEQRNLAEQQPQTVRELRQRLDAFAAEAVPPKSAPRAPDFQIPAVWGEFP